MPVTGSKSDFAARPDYKAQLIKAVNKSKTQAFIINLATGESPLDLDKNES